MPNVAEIRKISLRALHKSATQYWEKQHDTKRKFERTASMPSMKSLFKGFRTKSWQNARSENEIGDQESDADMSLMSESDNDVFSVETETKPYQSISFGFETKVTHEHHSKMTDVIEIVFNARTRRFFLLHSRGISSWLPGCDTQDAVKRELSFPNYKTKLLLSFIFCKKYNVYFTICSDFTLKVYNKYFHETGKAENKSMRSIWHLIFNPVTDELISSGVSGTTVWTYKQTGRSFFDTLKSMANYELRLHAEYPDVGGTWCTKVELITSVQLLFFCSDMNLNAYDAKEFRKLFTIHNAHSAALTCIGYSSFNRLLLTGSIDCEVKVWGASGGHICTLRGHSRAVSSIIIDPDIPGLVFTSSLDGTIKVWSTDTMELFCSLSVFHEGINWMNLTDDGLLWCANLRKVTMFKFHPVVKFWGHARCRIIKLDILEHQGKTRRLMAVGEDASVRLFSLASSGTLALCTVLPPPIVSLLDDIRDVTHSRLNHLLFVLIDQAKLWVYTTKTDPACRIAEWDIPTILEGLLSEHAISNTSSTHSISSAVRSFQKKKKCLHRCTQILAGKTNPSVCHCVLAVFSENGVQYDTPLGPCSARSRHLLVFGLEDGRLVFADQKRRGLLYCELQVNREAVIGVKHKAKQNWLITHCNNHSYSTFQIWKLPELELEHTIQTSNTISSFAVFDDLLVTGHSTGHVNVHTINTHDEKISSTGSVFNAVKQPEHRSAVIDVKSCTKRGIFCSSSADGLIKIWSLDKILLSEVQLGEDLSSCNFLNDCGDLVIGWKRHLFVIDHKTLDLQDVEDEDSEKFEKDSDIYEDPAIRYESSLELRGKSSTITMQKYLVPFGFVVTDSDDNMELNLNLTARNQDEESENSDATLCALTDTYLSPASSVSSFGIIDALFPSKSADMRRRKRSDQLILPEFGLSPGSTPRSSDEEYQIMFDDETYKEQPEISEDDNVFEPEWLKKEVVKVDTGQKLTTGAQVTKTFTEMKKKEDAAIPEEPQKSRFAGTQLDSKGLMKAGMTAVMAVETMKQNRKKSSTRSDRPPSGKVTTKKTRHPATAFSHRKVLVPSELSLNTGQRPLKDDASAGDHSPRDIQEVVEKTSAKLEEMGTKMTPNHKAGFAPSRQQQTRKSITGHTAKSDAQRSNKPKRRVSKSATVGRRKSSGKGGHRFKTSLPGTASTLVPLARNLLAQLGETDTSTTLSTGGIAANSAVTQVHMRYKPQMATNQGEQLGTQDSHVSVSDKQPASLKESDGQTVLLSAQSSKLFNARIEEDMKQILQKVNEEELTKLNDEQRKAESINLRELLERCRAAGDDDSDDDFEVPNLLDYDFHAIYKRDGLQFDEKWQDRMLERYFLLKFQKKQRHDAAMSKRVYLEQERHFRLLAGHPELLRKYNKPWFEDLDVLANHILNSDLLTGDAASPTLPPYLNPHTHRTDSRLSKRPKTVSSGARRNPQDGFTEKDGNFRFCIRPRSCDNIPAEKEHVKRVLQQTKTSALPPVPPYNSRITLKPSSSSSTLQTLITDRPRSSSSIPGKTRYILIKPETYRQPDKVVNPSKLEEQLLRRRFPSQHLTVLKSLRRINEGPFAPEDFNEDDRSNEPTNRAGTPVDERAIQAVHFSGMLGKTDPLFERSNAWISPFADAYVNPIDIVKRKSSAGMPLSESIHV